MLGTPTNTVSYAYNNSDWGDLLTAYDGQAFDYDQIGNITDDGTWTYDWQHGRQLISMTDGTVTWDFTYNPDGLRLSRSNSTTTYNYVYNGSQLTAMTVGGNTLYFSYDAAGVPMSVNFNGVEYFYTSNIQGDVIGIVDSNGTTVVTYTYDAWGNILSITGTDAATLGTLNPLRYRGYVYDQETNLYYLQSRYYNPELSRFINADALVSTGQGILGNNMFAYCGNNPTNCVDPSGHSWVQSTIITLIVAGSAAGTKFWKMVRAEINYKKNSSLDYDSSKKNMLINDQYSKEIGEYRVGAYKGNYNACGPIAVHNIKVLLGKNSTLSATIRDMEIADAILLGGKFGINPFKIDDVLAGYGINSAPVNLEDLSEEGTYFIMYWTGFPFLSSAHCVAVYYDGEFYATYNLNGDGYTRPDSPYQYAENYICGYRVS